MAGGRTYVSLRDSRRPVQMTLGPGMVRVHDNGRLDAHTYIQRLLPRDPPRWAEVLR